MALMLFISVCACLLIGYPVAISLAGGSLLFAAIATITGHFDPSFFHAIPSRLNGIMHNQILMAVPLFIFMGIILEKSNVASQLLETMAHAFGRLRSGLGLSVLSVGVLMAASTGIVGATVVAMGILALPALLRHGYPAPLATGMICAAGTLGQIIPPSIVLVLLGDMLSSANQQAQLAQGIFAIKSVSIAHLFAGALLPGLLLVIDYMVYLMIRVHRDPRIGVTDHTQPAPTLFTMIKIISPPLLLMLLVLGSIFLGYATPTEAAAIGAVGASILAISQKKYSWQLLQHTLEQTLHMTCMVFFILIGASIFSLLFRGLGGDSLVHHLLQQLPGGRYAVLLLVMLLLFLLGFILDFIEIIFVVVPIIAPSLIQMGFDPIWLGVMIALNLQTSFLTPPFGFALFYLRGVTPAHIETKTLYTGIIPFVIIQLLVLLLLSLMPQLVTYLANLA